jgi:ABC-type branched-subunit amino acid transport system permease subunit
VARWLSRAQRVAAQNRRGSSGIPGIARPIVFGFSFADSRTYLALCVGVFWVVGFCVGRLKHGKLGRAMQAVRDNELAAGVIGVDTYRTKVIRRLWWSRHPNHGLHARRYLGLS